MRNPPSIGLHGLTRLALQGTACLALAACDAAAPPAPQLPGLTMLPGHDAGFSAMPGDAALRRVHFRDLHGEGVLVLERGDALIDAVQEGEALEVAILTARLFIRPAPQSAWIKEWQRQIRQPCAGGRPDAGWYLEHVAATDLDGDGQAEITLASRTSCGGGDDLHQLHVSLIDGSTSYGIEGEARLSVPGEYPLVLERHDSATLATAPPAFVHHLDALWSALSVAATPGTDAD